MYNEDLKKRLKTEEVVERSCVWTLMMGNLWLKVMFVL